MPRLSQVSAHALSALALASTALAASCNPELEKDLLESRHHATAVGSQPNSGGATIYRFPQPAGQEATYPASLDGGPAAIYWRPAKNASNTKWTVSLQGGGWCYDEVDCLCRAHTTLGTTKGDPDVGGCNCNNVLPDGTGDDCNCIFLRYTDGASASGYRAEPHDVPGSSEKIWFRGIKNFDATLNFALAHGLEKATEFVLTGTSAGGLSTFLHADRAAAFVRAHAPNIKRITAQPVVGFFLDHDNFAHSDGYPGGPNSAVWSNITSGRAANYTFWMKYVYAMQNLTFGADGALSPACEKLYPSEPHKCFMSPRMSGVVETPMWIINSKYDKWQLENIFQSEYKTTAQMDAVLQYGKDFIAELSSSAMAPGNNNGAFITSCICHGCPWSNIGLPFAGKLAPQAYADWFYGVTKPGATSLYIDPRTPNGGGAMNGSAFAKCSPFPSK